MAANLAIGVVGLVVGQRVARIEDRVGIEKGDGAAQLVGARLGENLDAAEAQPVEFGGKGILVDADLADGFLGRQLAAAETIDVDLPAVGTGAGAGQRLQRVGKIVGIVRQRLQVVALDHQRGGVVVRLPRSPAVGLFLHRDFLFFAADRELDGHLHGVPSAHGRPAWRTWRTRERRPRPCNSRAPGRQTCSCRRPGFARSYCAPPPARDTLAAGITAPESSIRTPFSVPLVCCAQAQAAVSTIPRTHSCSFREFTLLPLNEISLSRSQSGPRGRPLVTLAACAAAEIPAAHDVARGRGRCREKRLHAGE